MRKERARCGGVGAGMGCISRAAVGLKPRPTGGVGDIAAAFIPLHRRGGATPDGVVVGDAARAKTQRQSPRLRRIPPREGNKS